MSVKPPPPALSSLGGLVRELHGPGARVVDAPAAGVVGRVDAADSLERAAPGGAKVQKLLGPAGAEDIAFRKRVVDAARGLAKSGASFSGSWKSDKVNKKLWTLGYGGRMQVRKFMPDGSIGKPSAALRDIFESGGQYGFECATAMMVIYHKAILDHVGDAAFDAAFSDPKMLAFFRWDIEDADYTQAKKLSEDPKITSRAPVPGSHYYFVNPDAAPENSAFRGENVIYLGDGEYYAHGIIGAGGSYVVTEAEILATLSALRKPGATTKPGRAPMEMHLDGLAVSKLAVPEPPAV
jgi:protein-glutamine gamma-glutamyltransferase